MMSICLQIEIVYAFPEDQRLALSFDTKKYAELVKYFQSLLQKHPVILFVDSLDQLSNEDQGRSDISFLKGVKPHKNTRIIVSSLPDDENYTYYCDLKLRSSNVPRVVVEMTDVSVRVRVRV